MKKLMLAAVALMLINTLHAQILTPVKWSYAAKKLNNKEAIIFIKASVDNGWHIYSQYVKDGGPIATSFKFTPSKAYSIVGKTMEPTPATKFETSFKMNVSYFEKEVVFQQKVKLNAGATTVKGQLEYMVCNNRQCLPPEDVDFTVTVK